MHMLYLCIVTPHSPSMMFMDFGRENFQLSKDSYLLYLYNEGFSFATNTSQK